jgi:hypothetical protein
MQTCTCSKCKELSTVLCILDPFFHPTSIKDMKSLSKSQIFTKFRTLTFTLFLGRIYFGGGIFFIKVKDRETADHAMN